MLINICILRTVSRDLARTETTEQQICMCGGCRKRINGKEPPLVAE